MGATVKSRAIVLHTVKYGDSSLIVNVLDRQAGRESLLIRGIGKGKGAYGQQLFTLNILDYVAALPQKGTLLYLREFSPALKLDSLRSDIAKNAMAIYIGELLYRCLREGDGDQALFDWLATAIETLDTLDDSYANFHLWFTLEFCSRLGFAPKNNFLENRQLFSSANCALLEKLMDCSLAETLAMPLSGAQRHSFVSQMVKYLSFYLDTNIEIRSLTVLHEIFS